MPSLRRSSLFSAVVLAGAALTTLEAACGSEGETSQGGDASSPTAQGEGGSGQGEGGSGQGEGGGTQGEGGGVSADASSARDAEEPTDGGCPPDSEIPVPPCALIK